MKSKYDIAIIGTGIGGATLAAILARQGLKVIVFEGGTHPRFTIGESMILETSEVMRALAEFYDVPELAYFSSENYYNLVGTSHGVKRHFSFLHHLSGENQNIKNSLQAVIPKLPYGHEMHIYRQDSDYFLTSVAVSYGADILQGTPVRDIKIEPEDVEIITDKRKYSAKYIVDAGGMNSILAEKTGWRNRNLRAYSRTIYTHMIDVPCFNDIGASRKSYGHPFSFSEGTLHHVFNGGWLWVIPFNNHARATNPLCSVGLQLDPRIHPVRTDLTAEEEFHSFIEDFPDIKKQFINARAVRAWNRTERLQYSSDHVVGDRFALLAHAAGFIDPLYSKGLYVTHMSIMIAADLILNAEKSGDYSANAFSPLEKITLRYFNMHDRLVANSYKSWSNPKLWSVYSILWLQGAYLEYLKLTITRLQSKNRTEYISKLENLKLVGGGFEPFFALQEKIDFLVENVDLSNTVDVDITVKKIRDLYSSYLWMPSSFRDILNGKNYLPNNKIRVNLLNRSDGFLGDGIYRDHFFGNMTMFDLIKKAVSEQTQYSTLGLRKQKLARIC